jgi:predicted small integral membrane protein
MYWSLPSALFLLFIIVSIVSIGICDIIKPDIIRKGFLPIKTSRGDRLFIGIISTIGIHLLWLAFIGNVFIIGALILSLLWFFIEAIWG